MPATVKRKKKKTEHRKFANINLQNQQQQHNKLITFFPLLSLSLSQIYPCYFIWCASVMVFIAKTSTRNQALI